MPNLTRLSSWKRYVPDLGDNRELGDKAFAFEIAAGLTKEQVADFLAKLSELTSSGLDSPVALGEKLADLLAPYVRFPPRGEPLSIEGRPILDLKAYMALVAPLLDGYNMLELIRAVQHTNSVEGGREVFYERLSGGFVSTPRGPMTRVAH